MSQEPRLLLRHDPSRVTLLSRTAPTTIGQASNNVLCLAGSEGVAPHHAVVRFSRSHGWLVCDWGSPAGTYLEGQRIQRCRQLSDGDEIQLGPSGPVLVFDSPGAIDPAASTGTLRRSGGTGLRSGDTALRSGDTGRRSGGHEPGSRQPTVPGRSSRPSAGSVSTTRPQPAAAAPPGTAPGRTAGEPLVFADQHIPLDQIRSAHVRSRRRYPHSFSWWVLACLGGLILLPFPWLFWALQIGALAAWIVLGSRKQHELVITLRDGMAHRHRFRQRLTAVSHRNGIRKAIGQSLESG